MRRNATREIVQVNFRTHGRTAPGRCSATTGPRAAADSSSRPATAHIAGETLGYFHQRALEVHGPATPVLAMGDFNDEPFDTSLVTHALSTRQRQKVIEGDTPRFWNLMWPLIGDPPDGTFYFDNEPNLLDQFLVNKNMAIAGRRRSARGRRRPRSSASRARSAPATTRGRSRSAAWASRSTRTGTPTTSRSG